MQNILVTHWFIFNSHCSIPNIVVYMQKLLTALTRMEKDYWNLSNSTETRQEALLGSGFAVFGIIASMVLAVIIIIDAFIAIMLLLSTQ